MSYFPMMVQLRNSNILIVGGGEVALRKAEVLEPFECRISFLAETFLDAILSNRSFRTIQSSFHEEFLANYDMVIGATDDYQTNQVIARTCRELKIPVNIVDDPSSSTFIFPALVFENPLTIAISTQGASPAAAAWYKQQLEEVTPQWMPAALTWMEEIRPVIMHQFATSEQRKEVFGKIWQEVIARQGILDPSQLEQCLISAAPIQA